MEIEFQKSGGLVPAIIQDERTGDVLMLGFMNPDSLAETQRTGEVVFFSRSRLLVRVEAVGPGVCHEGYRSCFFRKLETDGNVATIAERTFAPDQVYGSEKSR